MNTPLFEHILANFQSQIQIYQQLLDQGRAQLSFLHEAGWQRKRDRLYDIARNRSNLMDEIVEILHHNRDFQKEIAQRLGISEFHLSALKPHLPEADFARMEVVIQKIAGLLQQIKQIDEQCAEIIRNSKTTDSPATAEPVRYEQAARAYTRQAGQE